MVMGRILLLLPLLGAQVVFPDSDVSCGDGRACVPKDDCPEYRTMLQQRRDATAAGDTELRGRLVEELRGLVCHKEERRVCCPAPRANGEQRFNW
jgi:hypothetical protein